MPSWRNSLPPRSGSGASAAPSNPKDNIEGAFELAGQVGIDNLSMLLLGKHLGEIPVATVELRHRQGSAGLGAVRTYIRVTALKT